MPFFCLNRRRRGLVNVHRRGCHIVSFLPQEKFGFRSVLALSTMEAADALPFKNVSMFIFIMVVLLWRRWMGILISFLFSLILYLKKYIFSYFLFCKISNNNNNKIFFFSS